MGGKAVQQNPVLLRTSVCERTHMHQSRTEMLGSPVTRGPGPAMSCPHVPRGPHHSRAVQTPPSPGRAPKATSSTLLCCWDFLQTGPVRGPSSAAPQVSRPRSAVRCSFPHGALWTDGRPCGLSHYRRRGVLVWQPSAGPCVSLE